MEAKLDKLISSLLRVADIRNLDFDNPVKITLQTGELFPVIVLVSMQEPFRGKYPADVVWIDANPISPTYKHIYKRDSKQQNPATPQWQHSWTELFHYVDVFTPNQHYDEGDDENVVAIQAIVDHIHDITGNPHHITTTMLGALPITGGSMLGNLQLYSDPDINSPPLLAATKHYVDQRFDFINSITDSLVLQVSDLSTQVTNADLSAVPTTISLANALAIRMNQQEANDVNYGNLLASIQQIINQHSIDISLLNNAIGIGHSYLEEAVFNSFKTTDYTPFKTDYQATKADYLAIKADYQAFKQMALNIFQTAHTRVKTFEHIQTDAADTWSIVHNLNTTSYVVGLIDASNETLYAQEVKAIDSNNIRVLYNTPLVGRAIVLALT